MPGTLVDSNVILDVATNDPKWGAWSENALAEAARTGPLVINAVVFAEVSVGYARVEDADLALPANVFLRGTDSVRGGVPGGKGIRRLPTPGGLS